MLSGGADAYRAYAFGWPDKALAPPFGNRSSLKVGLISGWHTLFHSLEESVMKQRVYESLTTVFSVLIVSSFLYVWLTTY